MMFHCCVQFLLHHPVATTFLNWTRFTLIPAEHALPSLATVSSLAREGAAWRVEQHYRPRPLIDHLQVNLFSTRLNSLLRADFIQVYQDSQPAPQCRGRWRNKMCVFGLADLSAILTAPNLTVVNKVRLDKIKRVVIVPMYS